MLHIVNGRHHTGSIHIEDFIDSLDSFLRTNVPQRAYSMMAGTARPTSMMKVFVATPILPPLCAWICLVRIFLVVLDWLRVSAITLGAETASELSLAALGSHQSYPKCLELFPSRHCWQSSLKFSLLLSAEKLFRVQRMASHPNVLPARTFPSISVRAGVKLD